LPYFAKILHDEVIGRRLNETLLILRRKIEDWLTQKAGFCSDNQF